MREESETTRRRQRAARSYQNLLNYKGKYCTTNGELTPEPGLALSHSENMTERTAPPVWLKLALLVAHVAPLVLTGALWIGSLEEPVLVEPSLLQWASLGAVSIGILMAVCWLVLVPLCSSPATRDLVQRLPPKGIDPQVALTAERLAENEPRGGRRRSVALGTAAAAGVLLAVFPVVLLAPTPLDGLIYPMPLVLFALMSLVLLALDPWITAATAGRAWAASLILVAAVSLLHDICMPPQRIADGLLVFADARMHMLLPASALGMGVVHSLQPLKVAERAAAALIFGVFISCSALAAHAHTSEPRALLIFTYIVPPFIVGIACGEASKF